VFFRKEKGGHSAFRQMSSSDYRWNTGGQTYGTPGVYRNTGGQTYRNTGGQTYYQVNWPDSTFGQHDVRIASRQGGWSDSVNDVRMQT
jgi:hypothetical protein